jgi:hypothetical protein
MALRWVNDSYQGVYVDAFQIAVSMAIYHAMTLRMTSPYLLEAQEKNRRLRAPSVAANNNLPVAKVVATRRPRPRKVSGARLMALFFNIMLWVAIIFITRLIVTRTFR